MSNVRSLNRVILVGKLGKDPEMKVIASSGRDVAKFTMATNEGYFDTNKVWKDITEWHTIVAFGPGAKKAEKFAKGDLILVEGRIKSRKWTDKNNQERISFEIEANNLVVLEKRNRDGGGGGGYSASPSRSADAYQAPFEDRSAKLPEVDVDAFPGEEEDPF
jgi:single-strand DNA-binding protein